MDTKQLTADQRQALGESLAAYFGELDSDGGKRRADGGILRMFDYCDARNVDDLIDTAILPALAPAVAPRAPNVEPASAVVLMKRLKGYLMRVRIAGDDTLASYRRACTETECDIEGWLNANAAAPVAPAAPEGWMLVPIELTEEMHVAAVRTIIRAHSNDVFPPDVWRAMLAAAPTPTVAADAAAQPDERTAFEECIRAHCDPDRFDDRIAQQDGRYVEYATALAWEAWEARASQGAKQ